MQDIKTRVSQSIREVRKAKALTQKELAEKLGVAETTVNRYESGEQNLTIETLQKVANALEVDMTTFF